MREITKRDRNWILWTPWVQLEDLDFEDEYEHASENSKLQVLSKSFGLRIHPGKSKVPRSGHLRKDRIKEQSYF